MIHRTDTVSPLRSPWSCTYVVHSRRTLRRLLVPSATDARNFGYSCLFEVRGQELCPIGAKREARFSGATLRAHAVVSPLKFSAESRYIFSPKKCNETPYNPSVCCADSSLCTRELWYRRGGARKHPPFLPPLLERGGVERSETEGIRKPVFRYSKSNHEQTIPQPVCGTPPATKWAEPSSQTPGATPKLPRNNPQTAPTSPRFGQFLQFM